MQSLERRPWSATFNKDESILLVGEVYAIVECFQLDEPERPQKLWKIDFLYLNPIKSKIDDDHALSQVINPTSMSIEYAVKKILMINSTHAICGLGTMGLIFIIDISRKCIVNQHNIGDHQQIYDILNIKREYNRYIAATPHGLVFFEISQSYKIKMRPSHL